MSKHTPGPWGVDDDDFGVIKVQTVKKYHNGHRLICDLYNQAGEKEPNARLIAAAPELLEALRRCVAEGDLPLGVDADARIAILKAEGA